MNTTTKELMQYIDKITKPELRVMMKHSVSRLIKRYIDDSHLRQAVEPNSLQLDVLTVEKGLTQIEDTMLNKDDLELQNDRNLGDFIKK